METEPTNDTKISEPNKENLNWLFLLSSVLLGIAISITPVVTKTISGLYHVPGFGVIGGAIGGIAAGIIQVFSWKISKTIKTILYIVLIGSISIWVFSGDLKYLSEYLPVLLFTMIPGVVSFFVIYFVTKTVFIQLTKSPVNWWLFGFLLVVGIIITITAIGFLSVFFCDVYGAIENRIFLKEK